MYTPSDHTFAICAYRQSPYLGRCIDSLLSQNVPTKVIICTSTPNESISSLANKFQLPLFVNQHEPNIANDWNFAFDAANTKLVTIAHQDDIYLPNYTAMMLEHMNLSQNKPLMFFCDYAEIRNGDYSDSSINLQVKKVLLHPLKNQEAWGSQRKRRRILSLGSAICCPSVTLSKEHIHTHPFFDHYKSNLDWDAWERLSKQDGDFVYCPHTLLLHRIHDESETSALIKSNVRSLEDLEMLKRFWPKPIAKILNFFYSFSMRSNNLKS